MTKRILILTADTGMGHRSTANAIQGALQEQHGGACSVDIVNPMDHPAASPLLRNSQADYDRLVRDNPNAYKFGYQAINEPITNELMESALTVMLFQAVRDILKQYRPDVIVNTNENYLAPLDAVFAITRNRIPLLTVVTDLATLHRTWFHEVSDACCVPTQLAYDLGLEYGLSGDKMRLTGLPVNPQFALERRDKALIRQELGWQPQQTTLLAVGSSRVNNLPQILNVLNHSGLHLQLIVACGGSEALYQHFTSMDWHIDHHIYHFVDNMPTFMHAADAVIGKAGGLFVTEALACGLPILLVDMIQGQETGNADYVIANKAGDFAHNPIEALEIVFHWLDKDETLLKERARHATSIGRPHAVYDVVDLIWQLAEQGAPRKTRHDLRLPQLSSLADLLTRLNISWKDEVRDVTTPDDHKYSDQ